MGMRGLGRGLFILCMFNPREIMGIFFPLCLILFSKGGSNETEADRNYFKKKKKRKKKKKQKERKKKADTIQHRMPLRQQGKVWCMFNVQHTWLSWTLGTFHSLTFWLIITICVVASSWLFVKLASGVDGPAQGLYQLLPAAVALCIFLRSRQVYPLTADQLLGEGSASQPASVPLS